MSDPVLGALIGGAGAFLVALVGLLGTRWLAGVQGKAAENERRLREYELIDRHMDDLREDYDRMREQRDHARTERDSWQGRAVSAERRVEQWISEMEGR